MRNRETIREYVTGSLWVLPGFSAVLALAVGFILSRVRIDPGSPLAFQGTADDARTLLSNVTGTVVTVIALVLGLTVVALQLSSTQFSPRLLRSFLRDRPTQVVLSTFVATFVYSAAGLYTVGLYDGGRIEDFPRLAVTGAIVLLFASLAMVVYFADHLAHSIQIDMIGRRVERDTLAVVNGRLGTVEDTTSTPPEWAMPLLAPMSGYVQSAHPELLLPLASQHGVHVRLRVRVGEHIVSGTVLAWMWTAGLGPTAPDLAMFQRTLARAVQIGFERTEQQDAALGVRQLVDMACKALSPAVNDPYTAVQAIDHLSVIFCALAVRPLGDDVAADPTGGGWSSFRGGGSATIWPRCADSSAATAALNRPCRWRCSGCCTNAQACWPTIRPDGPRSASRLTSFWRTPPEETAQTADLLPVVAAGADLQRRVARHLPGQPAKSSTEPSATST